MAPQPIPELDFALYCLKNSPKPDFEQLGADLGITKSQAYHRHYALMKKARNLPSVAGQTDVPRTPGKAKTTTPAKGKGNSKGKRALDVEDDEDIEDGPVMKKVKVEVNGDGNSKENSAVKTKVKGRAVEKCNFKVKVENAEDHDGNGDVAVSVENGPDDLVEAGDADLDDWNETLGEEE